MDRTKHIALADDALTRAERLAGDAERYAQGTEREKAIPLAAAGALWADIARTHAAIAAAMATTEATHV
ncbi:hypothetical protein [Streptomyces sp. SID12488]|uniref:hypothetical protein n=1 Tax=Streptomyces sp. SID12488 TaxID=2706040 RepID=UPI0013D98E11|nr:hypothetical protein [Streptomyces sp. SID12488]NEA61343.1 hypothetical protein [Streptomyces sp. SID12488]